MPDNLQSFDDVSSAELARFLIKKILRSLLPAVIIIGVVVLTVLQFNSSRQPCVRIVAIDQMLNPNSKALLVAGVDARSNLCLFDGKAWQLIVPPTTAQTDPQQGGLPPGVTQLPPENVATSTQ